MELYLQIASSAFQVIPIVVPEISFETADVDF